MIDAHRHQLLNTNQAKVLWNEIWLSRTKLRWIHSVRLRLYLANKLTVEASHLWRNCSNIIHTKLNLNTVILEYLITLKMSKQHTKILHILTISFRAELYATS